MIELMDEPKTATPPMTTAEPLRRVGPPPAGEQPALLLDHATKRFVVGRKKKPVLAVNDVCCRSGAARSTACWARTGRARARSSGSSARC